MTSYPEEPWWTPNKRVEFFLERQEQIAQWATLADEAQSEARECIATLPVSTDDIGPGWIAGNFDPAEQVIGPAVFRPSWCLTTADTPDVAIAVSADGKVDPAGVWPKTSVPYVGVRHAASTDKGKAIKEYLAENRLPVNLTQPPMRIGWWPVYRYINADKSWWQHLSLWRRGIVESIADVAKAYDALISAAVESVRVTR